MTLKINNETFRYLSVFSTLTGVSAVDCFEQDEEVVYVVEAGKIGIAVGKNGSNIKKVENLLKRKIRLVENSQDIVRFVRNAIYPMKPENVYVATKADGSKIIKLQVDSRVKKNLMRNSKKLFKLLETLISRHFPSYRLEVAEK